MLRNGSILTIALLTMAGACDCEAEEGPPHVFAYQHQRSHVGPRTVLVFADGQIYTSDDQGFRAGRGGEPYFADLVQEAEAQGLPRWPERAAPEEPIMDGSSTTFFMLTDQRCHEKELYATSNPQSEAVEERVRALDEEVLEEVDPGAAVRDLIARINDSPEQTRHCVSRIAREIAWAVRDETSAWRQLRDLDDELMRARAPEGQSQEGYQVLPPE